LFISQKSSTFAQSNLIPISQYMPYPPHIQTLLDAGVAYEDMDGCVRMCSGYIDGGFPLPKIEVHVENHYTINNYYIQTQTPVTTMEKLVNTEIHNNYGVVISGGNNHVSITMKDGELQSVQSAPVAEEVATIPTTPQPNYPQPNHYADLARWIIQQKDTRDFIREANNNYAELARILSPIIGWDVEDHQLRKALSRIQ